MTRLSPRSQIFKLFTQRHPVSGQASVTHTKIVLGSNLQHVTCFKICVITSTTRLSVQSMRIPLPYQISSSLSSNECVNLIELTLFATYPSVRSLEYWLFGNISAIKSSLYTFCLSASSPFLWILLRLLYFFLCRI